MMGTGAGIIGGGGLSGAGAGDRASGEADEVVRPCPGQSSDRCEVCNGVGDALVGVCVHGEQASPRGGVMRRDSAAMIWRTRSE